MTAPTVTPFNQPPPKLDNQYDDDRVLRSYLKRTLPPEVLADIEPELQRMGELGGGELYALQLQDRDNDPTHTAWDAWGNRIDHVEVSPLWKRAAAIAAESGLIATAYEAKHGVYARLHQFALIYLFGASSDVYTCPLAMTDGAAFTLLQSGNQALIDRALPMLTSRDPQQHWTSGQWMTESTGGSDVGQTETVAQQDQNGTWRLYGRKWFTSAVTAQMALTLARPEGNGPGGSGLAMFFVELRDDQGALQGISLNRLKDKLGTRKVPTAELILDGTPATLVHGTENGTRHISPMLNITRLWNSVSAIGLMRRGLALARDFARRRFAFGSKLNKKALHLDTLAGLQAEFEGAFHLTFHTVGLLGRKERGQLDEHEEALLRLLTPITKLTTAKQTVTIASEVLESFGGAGYVEDTGLPVLLRDSQVLPIWEGTTNVLSLDTLRALRRTGGPATVHRAIEAYTQDLQDPQLQEAGKLALQAVGHAQTWLNEAMDRGGDHVEASARRFALTLGRSIELALLAQHAQWSLDHERDARAKAAALRFARHGVDLIEDFDLQAMQALADDLPLPA